jgi:hypothetical protein
MCERESSFLVHFRLIVNLEKQQHMKIWGIRTTCPVLFFVSLWLGMKGENNRLKTEICRRELR